MNHPTPSRMWETFLKIGDRAPGNVEGEAVYTDTAAAREETLAVLRLLRDEVAPTVRSGRVDWYCFLIHDRDSGVPSPDSDRGVYIHLRFDLHIPTKDGIYLAPQWTMTRRMNIAPDADTWDWWALGEESALVLALVKHYAPMGDDAMLRGVAQHLHHMANMTQMRVS